MGEPEEDPIPEPEPEPEDPFITSILLTIKRLLGLEADYTQYDPDIITHINSAFSTLNQLGVGPTECFSIVSDLADWGDFMGERTDLELIKSYIYLKVRLAFDPPMMGYLVDALKAQILEYEWRMTCLE